MGNARIPRLTNIMSQKAVACLVFGIGLTCLLFAHASGSEDYDDRLAAAEQIFWQNKIPQMYLWEKEVPYSHNYLLKATSHTKSPPQLSCIINLKGNLFLPTISSYLLYYI